MLMLLLLFSDSVISNCLQPHELQPIRLPCPSPSLRVCSNSCPLSWCAHTTISHPLSTTPSPPAFHLCQHIKAFSNESALHWYQAAKLLNFSFSISPSNEYLGLISFRIDWFDLQSLLQHHSSKATTFGLFPVVGYYEHLHASLCFHSLCQVPINITAETHAKLKLFKHMRHMC